MDKEFRMDNDLKRKQWTRKQISREVVLGGPEVLQDYSKEWADLCHLPLNSLPFSRPEWVAAYFRKQRKKRFVVSAIRVSGKLAAILPLVAYTRRMAFLPTRILRAPSEFSLWPFDIPIAKGMDYIEIMGELWALLRGMSHWDIIEIPNVPEGGVAIELLKAAAKDGYSTCRWHYMNSPYISLNEIRDDGDGDLIKTLKNAGLRKTIRNGLRKSEKSGGFKTHHFEKADAFILQRLYELEASGWKGAAGTAIASKEKEQRFIEEISFGADKGKYLSIHALELNKQICAVSLGFLFKNRHFGLKMGWDQNLRAYSIGHLLTHYVLSDCFKKGISELHLLGFKSDWKTLWTDKTVGHSNCYIFRGKIYGNLLKRLKNRSIMSSIRSFENRGEQIEGNLSEL
jgi:hypothetical protein